MKLVYQFFCSVIHDYIVKCPSEHVVGYKYYKCKLLIYVDLMKIHLSSTRRVFCYADSSRTLYTLSCGTMFTREIERISYTMKCMCPSAPVTITSIQIRMASGDGATM